MTRHFTALSKYGEKYVFIYDEYDFDNVIQVFNRFASNPELNFNHEDAEVLSKQVRERCEHT